MKDLKTKSNYHSNESGAFRVPPVGASTSSHISSLAMLTGRSPGPRLTRSQIASLLEVALHISCEIDDDEASQGTSNTPSNTSQSGNGSRDEQN
jgi:hypothetical protein